MTEIDAAALARDLRRSVGDFVRTVRQSTGTERSAQPETLDILDRSGAMNIAALAEKRGVTHQTMRIVVAQLETAGLVRMSADPADRRSRLVTIAPAAREWLSKGQEVRTALIEDAIRNLLSLEEQTLLQAAVPILSRLANRES